MGSYPLILMIYNTALEIEWDKRNISFLPNFRASSVTKCIKKLLMAYSCMKRGFKYTINEIILIFSSLPCYVRKEKLGKGNFLCKTWKIFYDSLNFLRISFPNYIYNFLAARNNTKETEHEIETNVNIELVILSCFKKTLTTNKSLKEKNYFAYSLLNALLSINLYVVIFDLVLMCYNSFESNCLHRCFAYLLSFYIK